jgi:FG-GAP-like repeat
LIAVGDFNGDGNPDVAVANFCNINIEHCPNSIVGILLGKGDGTFRSTTRYIAGFEADAIVTGDFNGDGNLDLAVASLSGFITILLGDGKGAFGPGVSYSSGGFPSVSLVVGDFNGDGKLDIAVMNTGSTGSVGILLRNGDGTFKPVSIFPAGVLNTGSTMVAADFNNDGKLDLALMSFSLNILLGNGDGTLQSPINLPISGSPMIVGDFNSDGKVDLAVAGSNPVTFTSLVNVYLGNGNASFQAPLSYATAESVIGFTLGDFNGDGKIDLGVAHADGAGVLVGNSNGTFRPEQTFAAAGTNVTLAIAAGDFNRDGKLDIAVAGACGPPLTGMCKNGDAVTLLMGRGNATFSNALQGYSTARFGIISGAKGDFNSDKDLDLVVMQPSICSGMTCSPIKVGVLLGNGKGGFQRALQFTSIGVRSGVATVGDFNRDGKRDLAIAAECATAPNCQGILSILLGKGDGTFQTPITYPSGGIFPSSIDVGDFNGDGNLDLVLANGCTSASSCNNGFFSLFLGNGDGSFQPAMNFPAGGRFSDSIAAADFNGDGKLDVAVAGTVVPCTQCSLRGLVSIVLGNGDGTFQAPFTALMDTAFAPQLTIGDFNSDGKPDVAVVAGVTNSNSQGFLTVFLGKEDGTLLPATSFKSGGSTPTSIATADFNGDGKPDLIVGNDSSTALLFGDGMGGFPTMQTYLPNLGTIGDFNNDGKPDLIQVDFQSFIVHLNGVVP